MQRRICFFSTAQAQEFRSLVAVEVHFSALHRRFAMLDQHSLCFGGVPLDTPFSKQEKVPSEGWQMPAVITTAARGVPMTAQSLGDPTVVHVGERW